MHTRNTHGTQSSITQNQRHATVSRNTSWTIRKCSIHQLWLYMRFNLYHIQRWDTPSSTEQSYGDEYLHTTKWVIQLWARPHIPTDECGHSVDWGYISTDEIGTLVENWSEFNQLSLVHDTNQPGHLILKYGNRTTSQSYYWYLTSDSIAHQA